MNLIATQSPTPTKTVQNRVELAKYFAKLGFTRGAEIGLYEGYYSEVLCNNIPNLNLLTVDNYPRKPLRLLETAKSRLAQYNVTFIRKSSMEAVAEIPDASLDFVFIDACHTYECVRDDIREWSKKVRYGGIVSGHDYYESRTGLLGVIKAVDEYVNEHGYTLQLTEWDRHNPVKDDRQPCWYFFKGNVDNSNG